MHKATAAHVKARGHEVSIQQHETDSPILPVSQLAQLHEFRPDLVDWVIQQTQSEAEHRRKVDNTINHYIFCQRILGQILASLLGLTGVVGGGWIAVSGQPWAGASIAAATITGLAVAFLTGRAPRS
ncbi:MAG: hypothetical protein LBK55_11900 [Azoarcus sp.]|jgi:uncharacterized membrane protein|nr:hypothetical protein [Azoarcus sp.]